MSPIAPVQDFIINIKLQVCENLDENSRRFKIILS